LINMKKIFIVFAILLVSVILVRAEGIDFPVSELGNCADKAACKAYCDETANMDACIKFAQSRGLMNKSEAEQARNYHARIASNEGPGGCGGLKECREFCSKTANLETCIAFAKEQGIKDGNVDEGEKILKFLKAGGSLPGGCDSKDNCRDYCGDFAHAEECAAFNKKAGIILPDNEVFIEAVKNGGPGGCRNKNECENYCGDAAHRQECLDFAVRAGILSDSEANNIKISGATGPGGCTSDASCKMYCDYPAHRDECYKFAEEHGYLTEAETNTTKNGIVSIRAGLEQAPAEVRACLKSTLGENIIGQIQSGNLVPGPGIGVQIKNCFEKFGKNGRPAEILKSAPSAVNTCLANKLGADFNNLKAGTSQVTPEMADMVRICFQQNDIQKIGAPATSGTLNSPPPVQPSDALRNFLKTAPPGILPCIKTVLGADLDKILAGENVPVDTAKLKVCFEQFRPAPPNPVVTPVPTRIPLNINLSQFPPEIMLCIKMKIGADVNAFIAQPDAGLKFEIIAKECSLMPTPLPPPTSTNTEPPPIYIVPTPTPTTTSTFEGTVCIQVLTPAKDPVTGACKVFATPCNVPYGWVRVDRCEATNTFDGTTVPSSTTISPTSYASPAYSVAQVFTPILSIFGLLLK